MTIRLGILTPSSNVALEPLTCRILADLPEVTAHFARFPVTEIALKPAALAQFDDSRILAAAALLADAKVDVICWSGTAAGWLGFATDIELCRRIKAETGIRATTSVLALNEALTLAGCATFGLVTPYTGDVQKRILDNYAGGGFRGMAERHLGLHANFDFAMVPDTELAALVKAVASEIPVRPAALVSFCTNLWSAHLAAEIEEATGLPFFDTVSTTIWKALHMTGIDTCRVKGWGSLFRLTSDQV